MEQSGRQSKLLGRLLSKLRGDAPKFTSVDKAFSIPSTTMSVTSMGCGSSLTGDDEAEDVSASAPDHTFTHNIDYRYGGQYLTADQLPAFCEQLQHLVQVVRNIQEYGAVTGEYPASLERRLEREAREVAALAAEARNARDTVTRARAQRRALRAQRDHLAHHLHALRETEMRELESSVRAADRKLYKSWELVKDAVEPAAFDPLLDEIRNKQSALESVARLVAGRRAALARLARPNASKEEAGGCGGAGGGAGAGGGGAGGGGGVRRAGVKRRRREPRSAPLSSDTSRHRNEQLHDLESTSRPGGGGVTAAGGVALAALELPRAPDLMFFNVDPDTL